MPTSVPCLSDRCSDPLPKPREELSGFAWAGLYEARGGVWELEMATVHNLTLSLVLLQVGRECGVFFNDLAGQACRLRKTTPLDREPGQVVLSGALHQRLVMHGDGPMRFPVLLPNPGRYMLFTEHAPAEHVLRIPGLRLVCERVFRASFGAGASFLMPSDSDPASDNTWRTRQNRSR